MTDHAEAPADAGDDQPVRRGLERDLLVLLLLAIVALALTPPVDPDLPGHLLYGLEHLEGGALLRADPYSFTARGARWTNHEWAFEWLMGWLWTALGHVGLVLLPALVWGGAGALVLRRVWGTTRDLLPAGVVFFLFAANCSGSMAIRPQLATFGLFVVEVALLEGARRGRPWLLLPLPLLFAAWVNLHGGFLAGLGVLGLYAAGLVLDVLLGRSPRADDPAPPERPGRTAALAAAAVPLAAAATLLNPYGLGLHRFLAASLGVPRPYISEWRPLELLSFQGAYFVALAACALVALLGRERRRIPLAHVLVIVVTAFLTLRHTRHIPFFAISTAFFATGGFAEALRRRLPRPGADGADLSRRQARVVRGLAAVVLVPAAGSLLGWPPASGLRLEVIQDAEEVSPFPVGALRFMEERGLDEGNLLVHFNWAQYAIWRLQPEGRVFFDGRFRTVYPEEVEAAYFAFAKGEAPDEAWATALTDYPTDMVLFPVWTAAVERLRERPGWREAYRDEFAALFVRRSATDGAGPSPAPVVDERDEPRREEFR